MRIEVGLGPRGALTDATSNRIIAETITPAFRQGNFYGGIDAGLDQMIKRHRRASRCRRRNTAGRRAAARMRWSIVLPQFCSSRCSSARWCCARCSAARSARPSPASAPGSWCGWPRVRCCSAGLAAVGGVPVRPAHGPWRRGSGWSSGRAAAASAAAGAEWAAASAVAVSGRRRRFSGGGGGFGGGGASGSW